MSEDTPGNSHSAPASNTWSVDGIRYRRAGVLSWGGPPFGSDPVAWACAACHALTLDRAAHAAWHHARP